VVVFGFELDGLEGGLPDEYANDERNSVTLPIKSVSQLGRRFEAVQMKKINLKEREYVH